MKPGDIRMTQAIFQEESVAQLVSSLREHLPALVAGTPVRLAYLYGSAAEGKTTPLSDVDIALVLEPQQAEQINGYNQLILETDVELGLERNCKLDNADVRVINHAPLMLQGRVVQRGKLLYSSDEELRIGFETLTLKMYLDFLPIDALFREAYFERARLGLEVGKPGANADG
jgi:predicted nucleotidyltransferase